MGNQLSPDGVHGCVGDWPGISGFVGCFFGAFRAVVRFLAAGLFRAVLPREPGVALRPAVFLFVGLALRFFAAFRATLSPPLIV